MTLSSDEFDYVRRMLEEQSGIALLPDQSQFVAGRLHPVAQRRGLSHLPLLISRMRDQNDRILMQEVVESLVTHETSFFRDAHYFDELAERTLPALIARKSDVRQLSIWCAACSTGQEVYSIAMILRERFAKQLDGWNVELLATDLSSVALKQARAGRYTDVEVRRGLSDARLTLHFRRDGNAWQIDERFKQNIRFQQLNLTGTWPPFATQDLILIRNVLVYMNQQTRHAILSRLQRHLHPAGCVMLGCSEAASIPNLRITTVRSGV